MFPSVIINFHLNSIINYLVYSTDKIKSQDFHLIKSDNYDEISVFRNQTIGLFGSKPYKSKKAPSEVPFIKWCALLRTYRTENYDDYKQLKYKLELIDKY